MSPRVRLTLLASLLATGLLCAGVSGASAFEGFGIEKLAIHTTVVEKKIEIFNGQEFPEYDYKPYEFAQAGGHPYALTTTLEFKTEPQDVGLTPAEADPKDVVADLPPGLLGDPMAVPRCPLASFASEGECPGASQIGVIELAFADTILVAPIYNLVPEVGQSAEFGFPVSGDINIILTAHLIHTAAGYGLSLVSNNIPQRGYYKALVTIWGVPADPSHDPERGRRCSTDEASLGTPPACTGSFIVRPGGEKAGIAPVPFLTLPADCSAGPEQLEMLTDSWQQPGRYLKAQTLVSPPELPSNALPSATGCGALSFAPSLEVSPETQLADTPLGMGVKLRVPQPEEPGVPATPNLRDATVTLPPGVSINPGAVDGIRACRDTGPEGINIPTGLNVVGAPLAPDEVGGEAEERGPSGEPRLAPGHCPQASVVGTAEAITPLLPEPVRGHLYLAEPLCGNGQPPCVEEEDARDGRLYRLYLELGGTGALADAGVNIKAAGVVSANLATGQLSSVFLDNPQAPFSELRLRLNGGPQASLANPQSCGEARTTSDLRSWSSPGLTPEGHLVEGLPDADPSSFYTVEGCGSPPPFAPGMTAGASTASAEDFSPFVLTLTRKDREQDLAGIQLHTPPGLLGMLSSVPLCEEPAAAAGTCPASSQIGTTKVASGSGSHPYEVSGEVYLTKSYKGAPFGLSVVTHAVAGPFDLGLIVVRARIDVDPNTSTLTVTSDPLPQIVFGVPLRLQRITVNVDRPNFMFNPSNCAAQRISATTSGSQQAVASLSSPFAVAGCRELAFKPHFTVTTSAHTSRAHGASLDAKVSFPVFKPGSEANVARVKVSLPRQLPSRLSTLQKACPSARFQSDPASCPQGSVVGIARASTPVLPVPLQGPVYFVSHGGEAFPSLIVVLEGDGVRVDLTGTTFISKAGITSSTFKTVPDVPVRSFELYLPEGKNSALAANANLCKSAAKLLMPTLFVAQNGAQLKQSTKIAVQGCPAPKRARAKAKGRAGK